MDILIKSLDLKDTLTSLPNGAVMPNREYQNLLDVITMEQKEVRKITISESNNSPSHVMISPKSILSIGCIVSGTILGITLIIKLWGSTDIAQQTAFRHDLDQQYRLLGERYDRLAQLAEKASERPNICVSFYCGGNSQTESERHEPKTVNTKSMPSAMRTVASWKLSGVTKEQAYKQLSRLDDSDREIVFAAINSIYEE